MPALQGVFKAARNLALNVAPYVPEPERDSLLRSVESHVIPAKAGIHFAEMDPRFRGGDDGSDFSMRAPRTPTTGVRATQPGRKSA